MSTRAPASNCTKPTYNGGEEQTCTQSALTVARRAGSSAKPKGAIAVASPQLTQVGSAGNCTCPQPPQRPPTNPSNCSAERNCWLNEALMVVSDLGPKSNCRPPSKHNILRYEVSTLLL